LPRTPQRPFGGGDVAPLDRAQAEHLGLSRSADSG
jgi:hypothetical protein